MSWLEVNWKQERPSDAATEWLWRSVRVENQSDIPPVVEEYLAELRRVNVNGDAQFARFHIDGNTDFNWFATRNRWDEISFFSRILLHPAVASALPKVTKDGSFEEAGSFEWGSSLTLDGELARSLVLGGAYRKFNGTAREAKLLCARLCEALFGDRFLDVEVFRYWKAWSPWFHDVAWDSTLMIIDRRSQIISTLVSTDTD